MLNTLAHRHRALVLAAVLACVVVRGASAQGTEVDLATFSIEDLMNVEITSIGRKQQRAEDVPAAVYVLSQDDIRRSGLRTLPELFRLVPGVQTAQVNGNNWAVSVRGFNDVLSNKLLVLIDGRSIYNRAFSGVFWNTLDLLVDDIERIEVVRGPGGAIWGANAVNGVINIVTKNAADSQGTLVQLGVGTVDDAQAAFRYGGKAGAAHYRFYSQFANYGHTMSERGRPAADTWSPKTAGLRVDRSWGANALMFDGSFMLSNSRPLWKALDVTPLGLPPIVDEVTTAERRSVIGRWTHTQAGGASLQIQGFVDIWRQVTTQVLQHEMTADVDVQYHHKHKRHDLVMGGGYRDADVNTRGSIVYALDPPTPENTIVNIFGQDEISLTSGLKVTLGSKLEWDSTTSWGAQPTVRAIWTIVPEKQRAWAALSRVLRTPTSQDLFIRQSFAAFQGPTGVPIVLGIVGNPDYHPEEFTTIEAGYRVQLNTRTSVDMTAFEGEYDFAQTLEPMAPVFESGPGRPHLFVGSRLDNLLEVDTRGFEISAHWMPAARWRLDGSYTGLKLTPRIDPTSLDTAAARFDGNAPNHQWQLRSQFSLGARAELDTTLFHMGRLREANVPAYTRADARLKLSASKQLSIAVVGTNLLDPRHVELDTPSLFVTSTQVPRRAALQMAWRF